MASIMTLSLPFLDLQSEASKRESQYSSSRHSPRLRPWQTESPSRPRSEASKRDTVTMGGSEEIFLSAAIGDSVGILLLLLWRTLPARWETKLEVGSLIRPSSPSSEGA